METSTWNRTESARLVFLPRLSGAHATRASRVAGIYTYYGCSWAAAGRSGKRRSSEGVVVGLRLRLRLEGDPALLTGA